MDTSTPVAPDKQPNTQPRVARPLKALADRLLIIGLDGATFDVLDPLMEDGRMPNLKRFIAGGTAGVLYSTQPPITPAAWTTFMTGKGPGRHKILDFEKYDATKHKLTFNSTYQIGEKTIWELLSEKGLRVGSISVPMTFPPKPINGFMISGFETPQHRRRLHLSGRAQAGDLSADSQLQLPDELAAQRPGSPRHPGGQPGVYRQQLRPRYEADALLRR